MTEKWTDFMDSLSPDRRARIKHGTARLLEDMMNEEKSERGAAERRDPSNEELQSALDRLREPCTPADRIEARRLIAGILRAVDRRGTGAEPTAWNEEAPTDDEVDGWSAEASELWGILHAALDRLPDEITGPDNPAYMARLERAYNAIPAICRLRTGALRAGGPPNEEGNQ